jgi:hypothetical protein
MFGIYTTFFPKFFEPQLVKYKDAGPGDAKPTIYWIAHRNQR